MKIILKTLLTLSLIQGVNLYSSEVQPEDEWKKSVLQVKITSQRPNHQFPWLRKKPENKESIGTYVGKNKILVLASDIEYSTSIEVKKFSSHNPVNANVEKVDFEANLALIHVEDEKFTNDLQPIKFQNKIQTSKTVSLVQLDNSGTIQSSRGRVTGIDIENYTNSYIELPYMSLSINEKLQGKGELILYKNKFIGVLYQFISA
ncbi:MAG: serine protease, partial [Leptospiraceae bacterium]|nr:serine protease [Leptospiraceae bacterium]